MKREKQTLISQLRFKLSNFLFSQFYNCVLENFQTSNKTLINLMIFQRETVLCINKIYLKKTNKILNKINLLFIYLFNSQFVFINKFVVIELLDNWVGVCGGIELVEHLFVVLKSAWICGAFSGKLLMEEFLCFDLRFGWLQCWGQRRAKRTSMIEIWNKIN